VVMHRGNFTLPGTTADASTRATGFGWDVAIGTTIYQGLVLAGALGSHDANVALTNNNTGSSPGETNLDYTHFSLLADWYVDPKKGLHFQGAIGAAQMGLSKLQIQNVATSTGRQTVSIESMSGAHFMLGAGYDTFVDNEWSIGLLLRLEAAKVSRDSDPKTEATMFTPSLRLSFTYHLTPGALHALCPRPALCRGPDPGRPGPLDRQRLRRHLL